MVIIASSLRQVQINGLHLDVRQDEDLIKHAKLVMVQLEIPLKTVVVVKLAKQFNVPVLC